MDVGKRMGKIFKRRGETNMRTTLRGKISLLFMTCALLVAIPAAAAIADTIQDNIKDNVSQALNLTVTPALQDQDGDGVPPQEHAQQADRERGGGEVQEPGEGDLVSHRDGLSSIKW